MLNIFNDIILQSISLQLASEPIGISTLLWDKTGMATLAEH